MRQKSIDFIQKFHPSFTEIIFHENFVSCKTKFFCASNLIFIINTQCGINIFARCVFWQVERRETMSSPIETSSRDPLRFVARVIEARDLSLRDGRWVYADDDDRFCQRSLLLFLIFLWWPYVPLLYHFLSLVILVLYIFSSSLFLSFSLLLLNFLFHRECKPLSGRCSRNCLQSDGIEKKDDLVPRQTKGIQEGKRRSRNDYLATFVQNNT